MDAGKPRHFFDPFYVNVGIEEGNISYRGTIFVHKLLILIVHIVGTFVDHLPIPLKIAYQ